MQKAFSHLARCWYADSARAGREAVDEVIISIGDAELAIRWYSTGLTLHPRLEVFDDSWIALATEHDLMRALAGVHRSNLTPIELCDLLVTLGYTDATAYERSIP